MFKNITVVGIASFAIAGALGAIVYYLVKAAYNTLVIRAAENAS